MRRNRDSLAAYTVEKRLISLRFRLLDPSVRIKARKDRHEIHQLKIGQLNSIQNNVMTSMTVMSCSEAKGFRADFRDIFTRTSMAGEAGEAQQADVNIETKIRCDLPR